MDCDEFLQLLPIPDPEAFVKEVIVALEEVYRFNADRMEPEMGDDEQWFGFSVYRNGWHRIETRLAAVTGVHTSRPQNSLLIEVSSDVRFHVYRGGNDESYDIYSYDWSSGTKTKVSIAERNSRQLSFFDQEVPDEDHTWRLDDLAIVHAGNAEDGLTGVWAGAPLVKATNGSQWAWVVQLYESAGGSWPQKQDGQPDLPPFDQSPEPDLDLGLRREQDGDEAVE